MHSSYETHGYSDPNFPLLFHLDTISSANNRLVGLHWHENVELLFCIEGESTVISNARHIKMHPGDLAVVNSDHLHSVFTDSMCRYYCLIPNKSLCPGWNSYLDTPRFQGLVQDGRIQELFQKIIDEMTNERPHFKSAVKAYVALLFTELIRCFSKSPEESVSGRHDNRIDMVKSAIRYLKQHYCEEISVEDICRHVGFSKYYFCHTFKELTGRTVINYLNFLRCQNVRSLLASGSYNIRESAELSGFHSMSYFSRTYKSQMGELPSHPD